mmetsp:Transcript_56309/g.163314  ORF Transcript_56309/g.163314 Transcript_56309/m.163314 type:complete len:239 (-) Transcript_56309:469-1185(-)
MHVGDQGVHREVAVGCGLVDQVERADNATCPKQQAKYCIVVPLQSPIAKGGEASHHDDEPEKHGALLHGFYGGRRLVRPAETGCELALHNLQPLHFVGMLAFQVRPFEDAVDGDATETLLAIPRNGDARLEHRQQILRHLEEEVLHLNPPVPLVRLTHEDDGLFVFQRPLQLLHARRGGHDAIGDEEEEGLAILHACADRLVHPSLRVLVDEEREFWPHLLEKHLQGDDGVLRVPVQV